MSKVTLLKRFDERVERAGADDCGPWKLKPNEASYGCLSMGKGTNPLLADRVAWELAHGPIPEGLFVKQQCGTRLCCNPAHLYLYLNPNQDPEVSARAVKAWLHSRT